jgi:bifunctional non-homologous end joining protein LigD
LLKFVLDSVLDPSGEIAAGSCRTLGLSQDRFSQANGDGDFAQEVYFGGFTEGKGSRLRLGALLLGGYRNGKLHYFGHSGSGFSEKGIEHALGRMRPLFTDKSPFENPPTLKEKIQWVKPELVCEIAYAEWTLDGELRRTTFLGWRDDKRPEEVVLEEPKATSPKRST